MTEVTFTVDGYGEFACDADEVKSYRVLKKLARSDEDPSNVFDVMEDVFMGRDEEYIDRMGGGIDDAKALLDEAVKACGAKNSSASSCSSNAARETK